jgi:hypothetical protein
MILVLGNNQATFIKIRKPLLILQLKKLYLLQKTPFIKDLCQRRKQY